MTSNTLEIINKKYSINVELTNGEFGRVFKAKHILSNSDVVIKIEKKSEHSLLLHEIKIYNYLKNYNYISKIRNFYNDNINNILIIDYNGDTLYDLKFGFNNFEMREKINLINNICINIVNALEELHNFTLLYRDIKPQNLCYYNNNIKLIDLGFCKYYEINNKHIENIKLNKIVGTPNYISKNVLELNSPSRRDDLESIFFIYLFLFIPTNIWIKYSTINDYNKKDILFINELLNNINNDFYNNKLNIEYLKDYLINIRKVVFQAKPNYNTFKTFLKAI